MKHVLCAHLRHWPIDRLRRRRPELRHKALALVETIGNRSRRAGIAHVSPEATGGISPGMTPAEAKARHAKLICLPAAPADDLHSLEALGRWLMRFSPSVCVYPPQSLFLDATGLQRLFGGLQNFRRHVADALAALRISATIAIAPTPGAAWALAAFGAGCIVADGELPHALRALPPEALRLDPAAVEMLHSLGVRTIGSLLQLPRDDLVVRFGPAILQRIDQAMGAVPEPLTFLEHRAPIRASMEFDGAIESLEAIHLILRQLIADVARQLACRGLGARELRLTFQPPYASPVEKMVQLMRPCRNESDLFNLLQCAVETVEGGGHEGFIAASLCVRRAERLGDEQPALVGAEQERDAAELDHLIERLRARLGGSVEWAELVESNLPEKSFCYRENPVARDTRAGTAAVFRPICLLPRPRAIKVIVMPSESRDGQPVSFTDRGEVHRLVHVLGPERITGQWWNGRWKTRDYFDVFDAIGNRYWLFRVAETGTWFLHGLFE
ncbi:MAG TPA: DNA polymerase Y family protein [Tepidisphaeraceae bacterium]|nr:DNA polymerase Y family protein [Tepidisphaeraceae bacterium]